MPPPAPRRPLNVRLPADLLEQVEADGGKKQAIVEDALRAWFDDDSRMIVDDSKENGGGRADDSTVIADDSRNDSKVLSNDSMMITALTGQLGEKDRQIAELHVMLHTAITPPLQLPAAEPEAQAERRWWEFWKRNY